ncbi:L-dopachrome tautomerase-related protein [Burkholderia orbicola]|uniref:L-dopachrome tautomerase-related protein n=1 Tax=Burkholderia orbicola TaxID=2978683 RepID=UPI002652889F|nr:L-dopachrome tautomerase-related protein [Burkholderia orbicola]MDN7560759.1 L-dopachrome tautomerase-related protein [Burkholderia orbicola]
MKRRSFIAAAAGAALVPMLDETACAGTVSGDTVPDGSFEIVAAFPGPGPSGIAVTPEGRVFVGFPRHADNHRQATLAELKGRALVPYPDAELSLPSDRAPEQRLVSIHGMTTDSLGRLWAIDDGKLAGKPITPGAAKVVGIDPRSDRVIANVVLKPPAMRPDSHMNDLRVDLTHGAQGVAYIADSSFGTSGALVVVDIATGRQRRVLADHSSTQPEQGFVAVLEGRPLRYDPTHPSFPVGGADSITLSADSSRLYYSPLTSRRLYSIATDLLADFDTTDTALAREVVDHGEKVMTDGMATDSQNRIYLTAGEHDSILRRHPDGHLDVVVRDPRIVWPDGIFATATHVYCTLGQWNRLPGFNGGTDLRVPPYLLIRVPIDPARAPISQS